MAMLDLFGEPIMEPKKDMAKGGYRPQGTGPGGETCGTCANCKRIPYHGKSYYKCALVPPTHGPGTDIRLKWAACSAWRPGRQDDPFKAFAKKK